MTFNKEDTLGWALAWLQKPTVVALNAALIGCILCLAVLLVVSLQTAPNLAIHVCIVLVLAIGLLILVNWWAWLISKLKTLISRLDTLLSVEHVKIRSVRQELSTGVSVQALAAQKQLIWALVLANFICRAFAAWRQTSQYTVLKS